MRSLTLSAFLLVTSVALTASAEAERVIESARIHVRDVSDGYGESELGELDLGPAPPPGASRLLSRSEVEEQLRGAGGDTKSLHMPSALRVKSAARRWSPDELRQAMTPKLLSALPAGLKFKGTKFSRSLLTSPAVQVGAAHFPKFPKREGELTLTVTVDFVRDEVTVLRVPVTVIVFVSEEATRPALSKGGRVNLVIEHGPARVSALATALSDIELGELGSFRVSTTQRILRARLISPDSAQVVE